MVDFRGIPKGTIRIWLDESYRAGLINRKTYFENLKERGFSVPLTTKKTKMRKTTSRKTKRIELRNRINKKMGL